MKRWQIIALALILFAAGHVILGRVHGLTNFIGECLIYASGIFIGCLVEKEWP